MTEKQEIERFRVTKSQPARPPRAGTAIINKDVDVSMRSKTQGYQATASLHQGKLLSAVACCVTQTVDEWASAEAEGHGAKDDITVGSQYLDGHLPYEHILVVIHA